MRSSLRTWQLQRLLEVIEYEFWKDWEPLIMFEKIHLRPWSIWAWRRLGRVGLGVSKIMKGEETLVLTTKFLRATKTLGADTTAMVESSVASRRSSFAISVAVSSEYWRYRTLVKFSIFVKIFIGLAMSSTSPFAPSKSAWTNPAKKKRKEIKQNKRTKKQVHMPRVTVLEGLSDECRHTSLVFERRLQKC